MKRKTKKDQRGLRAGGWRTGSGAGGRLRGRPSWVPVLPKSRRWHTPARNEQQVKALPPPAPEERWSSLRKRTTGLQNKRPRRKPLSRCCPAATWLGVERPRTSQSPTPGRPRRLAAAGLPVGRTFGDVPRGEGRGAGGAGGCGLAGRRAATQDGSVRLVLQDAGHEAPLLVLGQAGDVSSQRRSVGRQLVGAQLVEADRPFFSPTGTGLRRGGGRVCEMQAQ